MKVKSLSIRNYRNYDSLKIEFADNINVIYGDNAQGKTNILEAIFLCATSQAESVG